VTTILFVSFLGKAVDDVSDNSVHSQFARCRVIRVLLGTALGLLLSGPAFADGIWNYAGNTTSGPETGGDQSVNNGTAINPCGCALDGSVTLNDAGQAIAWSFTAGALTLDNLQ
jgi:hypothetical protein